MLKCGCPSGIHRSLLILARPKKWLPKIYYRWKNTLSSIQCMYQFRTKITGNLGCPLGNQTIESGCPAPFYGCHPICQALGALAAEQKSTVVRLVLVSVDLYVNAECFTRLTHLKHYSVFQIMQRRHVSFTQILTHLRPPP